jgi:hypothetical protein
MPALKEVVLSTTRWISRRGTGVLVSAAALAALAAATVAEPSGAARQGPLSHEAVARMASLRMSTNKATKPVVAGVVFGGFTPQHWPSVFQVAKDGKSVVTAGTGLDMTCTSGGSFSMPDRIPGGPIAKGGRFTYRYVVPLTTNTDGTSFTGTGVITATFDAQGTAVTGTWQAHATFISASGTRDECDSGPVSFTDRQ